MNGGYALLPKLFIRHRINILMFTLPKNYWMFVALVFFFTMLSYLIGYVIENAFGIQGIIVASLAFAAFVLLSAYVESTSEEELLKISEKTIEQEEKIELTAKKTWKAFIPGRRSSSKSLEERLTAIEDYLFDHPFKSLDKGVEKLEKQVEKLNREVSDSRVRGRF